MFTAQPHACSVVILRQTEAQFLPLEPPSFSALWGGGTARAHTHTDICDFNDSKDYTIHIYTDGSKNENGGGSGIAIYTNDKLTHQIKYKLHNSCSNNQAEQTAILKTLGTIKLRQSNPRTAKIHTDSRITLLSLKNPKNRKNLIEEIRKKTATLKREKWKIVFTWIKAQAGNSGNELADQLAKDALNNNVVCFNKVPKSEIIRQESQSSLAKWQKEWDKSTKGQVTKDYFPDITDRLRKNQPNTQTHGNDNCTWEDKSVSSQI